MNEEGNFYMSNQIGISSILLRTTNELELIGALEISEKQKIK
jgi:hypothetical protein